MSADTGTPSTTLAARRALAEFLRESRRRVPLPAATPRARRRTPGLRREEVAARAGVSATWYTWLEQARPVNPSPRTLGLLADALELDPSARAHLFALAPAAPRGALTTRAEGDLLLLLETLAPHPAYAVNGRWDLLAANRPAERVFGRFSARPGVTDNILRRLFLDPAWRASFGDRDALVASAVAQFRAATAALTGTEGWAALVGGLAAESPEFARLWAARELAPPASHAKSFRHRTGGLLRFHYSSLAPDGAPPDVRVIIYRPADARSRAFLGTGAR